MSSLRRNIVTARDIVNDEQIFIKCDTVQEALNIAGKLHKIELKEHTYSQIRLRSTHPSLKQGYRWVNLVKWIGGA
jgi:predicted RNA-binding protein